MVDRPCLLVPMMYPRYDHYLDIWYPISFPLQQKGWRLYKTTPVCRGPTFFFLHILQYWLYRLSIPFCRRLFVDVLLICALLVWLSPAVSIILQRKCSFPDHCEEALPHTLISLWFEWTWFFWMLSFRCTSKRVCLMFVLGFVPFSSLFLHWRTWSIHPSPLQNLKWASYWDGPIFRVMMGLWNAVGQEQSRYDDKCLWNVACYSRSRKVVLFLDCFWRTCFLFCLEDDEVTPHAEMPWTYYQLDGNAIYFRQDLLLDMLLKRANPSESPKITVWQSEERVR